MLNGGLTVGTLDCVQYSVSLCMAEKVSGDHKVKEDQQDKILSHSRHHEVSLGFDHSHFVLPVPLQLAPSFSTPVCSVSYYLHFEFVTTAVAMFLYDFRLPLDNMFDSFAFVFSLFCLFLFFCCSREILVCRSSKRSAVGVGRRGAIGSSPSDS